MELSLAAGETGARPRPFAPTDLLTDLREALRLEGELPPCDEKVLVLCRVVTGYLRTSPLAFEGPDDAREHAIAAFAAAYPRWWHGEDAPYLLVARLLDDVFHQREVAPPPSAVVAMLHRIALGLLRRKGARATHAAQLAMADWLASLYLLGSE
jgi:hypothetical protein